MVIKFWQKDLNVIMLCYVYGIPPQWNWQRQCVKQKQTVLFLWIIRFLNRNEKKRRNKKHYTYKVWPKYSSHFKIGYIFGCFIWVYFCATYNKCSEFVMKLSFLHDYWHVYWQRCNAFTWTKTTKKQQQRKERSFLFCFVLCCTMKKWLMDFNGEMDWIYNLIINILVNICILYCIQMKEKYQPANRRTHDHNLNVIWYITM